MKKGNIHCNSKEYCRGFIYREHDEYKNNCSVCTLNRNINGKEFKFKEAPQEDWLI